MMLPSIPAPRALTIAYRAYVALFFLYLAIPLVVVAVFAFNDSLYPSLPWKGFTLDWFFGTSAPKIGLFYDTAILRGLLNSLMVAVVTTAASVFVGTTTAFLFERYEFRFKGVAYMLMLAPLVIPASSSASRSWPSRRRSRMPPTTPSASNSAPCGPAFSSSRSASSPSSRRSRRW